MHTGLTTAQRAAYETEGYIAPVRGMSEVAAADCLQALHEAEARWPDALGGPGRNNAHYHGSGPNVFARRRVGFAIQSYIAPNVEQVIGRIDVQQARGGDPYGHHDHRARVRRAMDDDDVAFRDAANERLAAIFYEGAKRRGRF